MAKEPTARALTGFLLVRGDWHEPDGVPFFGMKLTVPEGWEHLRDDFEDDDEAGTGVVKK